MRTRDIKAMSEANQEDYELYLQRCEENEVEPMDIFAWTAMEQTTAEEEMNDYLRDEGIDDA